MYLCTANPVESTFSTIKAREDDQRRWLAEGWFGVAFRLLLAAEKRWRRVNAPYLVALVKAGVEFPNGESEMLQSEPAPGVLSLTPSVFAAEETLIHNT